MSELNPENKCAHLIKEMDEMKNLPTIQEMFKMQRCLQEFYAKKGKALDPSCNDLKARVDDISVHWKNLTLEFAELLERLPHKAWKTYTEEEIQNAFQGDNLIETKFEFIDCFHFFMNIGLLLGIDGDEFAKLYALKNKENFARIESGY